MVCDEHCARFSFVYDSEQERHSFNGKIFILNFLLNTLPLTRRAAIGVSSSLSSVTVAEGCSPSSPGALWYRKHQKWNDSRGSKSSPQVL